MGFKAGQPRPANAGRKKGTPNKSTQDLMGICSKHGVNPFEAMVIAAMEIDEPKAKVDAWEKVCQYIMPKRKAIEHSMEQEVAETAEEFEALPENEKIIRLQQAAQQLKQAKAE